jgi:hypothetical protein
MDSRLESWRSRQIRFLKAPDCDKNDSGFSIVDICALSQAMLASLIRANAQFEQMLKQICSFGRAGFHNSSLPFQVFATFYQPKTHTGEVADISPNENRFTNPNSKPN